MELLTIRETARRAKEEGMGRGVNEYALRRWVKSGALPCIKAGSRVYIKWSALLTFLEGK